MHLTAKQSIKPRKAHDSDNRASCLFSAWSFADEYRITRQDIAQPNCKVQD